MQLFSLKTQNIFLFFSKVCDIQSIPQVQKKENAPIPERPLNSPRYSFQDLFAINMCELLCLTLPNRNSLQFSSLP